MENGDLLAIIEGAYSLIKLDKDSNILWVFDENTHHDLSVAPDGRIYVLTREAEIKPEYNKEFPILEDDVIWRTSFTVATFSSKGAVISV